MKLFKYDVDISLGYDGGFIALPLSLSYSGTTFDHNTACKLIERPVTMKAWVLRVFCFYFMVEAYKEGK